MKVAVDLPPGVAHSLKAHAAEASLKPEEVIVEACRVFLEEPKKAKETATLKSPFPLLKGGLPAMPGEKMTPERVAEIL